MIHTASVYGFVRTILIILLIYFGVKILARLFAPILLKFAAKKVEKRFGQQFEGFKQQQQRQQQPKTKVGETVIDKVPQQKSSSTKNVGEYIDYEEID
ncbi:DUF4834 family protein [Winogradskyella maritima]|nr:DUF4834 family protein [Winogradskyella maritima]